MSAHTIVADIGTGAVKIECFDRGGRPLASSVGEYGATPRADTGTIDPDIWYEAFGTAVHDLSQKIELGVSKYLVLSGQMQDLVLVADGRALDEAVMYYAARPGTAFESFVERVGSERVIGLTHNVPDAAGFAAKLLAIAEEPGGIARLAKAEAILCGAHDYVAYRLTGNAATDRTTASTTGLFDPVSARWVGEIVDTLPIDREMLPPVVAGDRPDGSLGASVAGELGLPVGLTVIHGVGDVGAAMLVTEQSGYSRSCYLGTSGWILDAAPLSHPADPEYGVFNLRHPTEEKMIRVAPLLTAAGAFDWFINTIDHRGDCRSALFDSLAGEAADFAPEEVAVLFLPYLAGERSPFKDPHASGAFVGLRSGTGRGQLFRAVEEGVAFALRSVMQALAEGTSGQTADVAGGGESDIQRPLLLTGGGSAVRGFPQLLADVTGSEVAVVDDARFAGTRALPRLVAGSGDADVFAGLGDASRLGVTNFTPRVPRGAYDRKYDLFREAYSNTKGLMRALSESR